MELTNSSLRKQLLITIIVMMMFVSVTIVWVSLQAGANAVNNMTQQVMLSMIGRIGNDNEHQLSEAVRILETIAPTSSSISTRQPFPIDVAALEQRLWFAGNLYEQTTSDIYFASPDGRFVGFHRIGKDELYLYSRFPDGTQKTDFEIRKPGALPIAPVSRDYDARVRPWYVSAVNHDTPVWSEIYNNYVDNAPTITLAKAVYQPDHSMAGVVATDIALRNLSDYLRTVNISAHSVAYIVDANGKMIASSADYANGELSSNLAPNQRVDSIANELIRQTYLNAVKGQVAVPVATGASSKTIVLNNEKVDVAYASLGARYGLNWISVVAVPRSDFLGGITQSLVQSIVIVLLFIVLALIAGWAVIEHMLRDIRQLTSAALKIGNGEPLPRLHIHRKDEIGHLVKTFIEMENKLRFDRLTQVHNRDFLIAQIDFMQRHALQDTHERVNFTLLFLDLDRFKEINDTYGHAAGDQLLIVIAARLKAAVRETDTVSRFGGDEFVVLLNGTSESIDIQTTVDKIHALVEQPIALSSHIVSVQVSVGWAIFPTEAQNFTSLIEIADARMFSSKKEHHEVFLRLVETKN